MITECSFVGWTIY